ncbi:PREDICTED: uncharacterized protein LOC106910731 [Poecilia mexicana]|uniref:uncharacterized protein LOC106910731 n=1 Tax=Poecilia mexicana TaxID=48701 RepID=UPI00072ED0A5|nr:PREDICTED: uncharacterized protein LOC106910731 [Poecilia mexicana]
MNPDRPLAETPPTPCRPSRWRPAASSLAVPDDLVIVKPGFSLQPDPRWYVGIVGKRSGHGVVGLSLSAGHLSIPALAAVILPDRDASTRRFEHWGSFQMPLEGPYTRCPICRSKFAQLPKHLDRVHHVLNQAERKIPLAFAHGQVNIRGIDCPVRGCNYRGPRVDRHLYTGHRELDIKATDDHLRTLQWRATVRALAKLRSTEPTPQLVSELDVLDQQAPAPDSPGEDGDVSSSPGTPQRTAPEPLSGEEPQDQQGLWSCPAVPDPRRVQLVRPVAVDPEHADPTMQVPVLQQQPEADLQADTVRTVCLDRDGASGPADHD